jgi:hypothetical protein
MAEPVLRTARIDDRSSAPTLRRNQDTPTSAARIATPTASALPAGPSSAGQSRLAGTGCRLAA